MSNSNSNSNPTVVTVGTVGTKKRSRSSDNNVAAKHEKAPPSLSSSLQSPHTLRLLKLIRDGGSHVSTAVLRLQQSMMESMARGQQQQQQQQQQLWDLLCRLQSIGTVAPEWQTRLAAAHALQVLATLVPVASQRAFLEQPYSDSNSNSDSKSDSNTVCFLTVYQLLQQDTLDRIVAEGRRLYATAESKWEETEEEEIDAHSVQERMRLQRQILAQRLGLLMDSHGRVILSAGVDLEEDPQDPQEEEARDEETSSTSVWPVETVTVTDPAESKRQKHVQKIQQQRRRREHSSKHEPQLQQPQSSSPDTAHHNNNNNKTTADEACQEGAPRKGSVHALVLLELQQSNNNSSNNNPQHLLATELLFRTMDPVWYVRHGAILGLLALVKAWRSQLLLLPTSQTSASLTSLGAWPHDILARSLCVLALDRFGDFSGATIQQQPLQPHDNGNYDDNSITTSTSVVAPVREVAGQLVAVLWAMAPSDIRTATLQILWRLTEHQSDDWEVRHGAWTALKYISVVETTTGLLPMNRNQHNDDEDQKSNNSNNNNNKSALLECLARNAVQCLASDTSDDVQCLAAQILVQLLASQQQQQQPRDHQHDRSVILPDILWTAAAPVWRALQTRTMISSGIVDLVTLLSELLRKDAARFVQCTSAGDRSAEAATTTTIHDVAHRLLQFLESDFVSVRTSALRSLGILASDASFSAERSRGPETLALLVERVFALFFSLSVHAASDDTDNDNDEDARSFRSARHDAWRRLADIAARSTQDTTARDSLKLRLFIRYYNMHQEQDETAVTNTDVLPMDAAHELAYFLGSSCGSGDRSSELVLFMLLAGLQSPRVQQCECACLLYRALKANHYLLVCTETGWKLDEFEQRLDPQATLLCLVDTPNENHPDGPSDGGFDRALALCDQAWTNLGKAVADRSKTAVEAASALYQSCVDTLQAGRNTGQSVYALEQSAESATSCTSENTVESMRARTTLVGALLARGGRLPTKLSPLIRILMTSFHNERGSAARRAQTNDYLADLLLRIREDSKFEKAHSKILGTLCDAAISCEDGSVQGGQLQSASATAVLRTVVNQIPSDQLRDAGPIWMRLRPLTSSSWRDLEAVDLIQAIRLVQVIAVGADVATLLIEQFAPALVDAACHGTSDRIKSSAASGLETLCQLAASALLHKVLPLLVPKLRDENDNGVRNAGCLLLNGLVKHSDTQVCPFVRTLLPLVLSLVTDDHGCARTAYCVFASLVRVAPLVRQCESVTVDTMNEDGASVIDHLIFGEPLPPVSFPVLLTQSLHEANISLRPYQKEGIAWLRFLHSVNLNGALCDEMGCGKTLQSLVSVALAHCDAQGRDSKPLSLVVCPSTLVSHWISEIAKYFPEQKIFCALGLSGSSSMRRTNWHKRSPLVNILVISYSALRSDIEFIERETFCCCILDEGHLMKNTKTVTARAARRIRAKHKLVLTGTPVQNRVSELWAIFDFIMPNFLGTSSSFAKEFASPIAKSQLPGASAACIVEGMSKLKALHQQVLPFILRREKCQVLKDLPPSTVTVIKIPMSTAQKIIYGDFCARRDARSSLKAFEDAVEKIGSLTQSDQPKMDRGMLKSLLFLRLLCTHPLLVLTECQRLGVPDSWLSHASSGKMLALAELLREAGVLKGELTGADNDTSLLYCDDDSDEQDAFDAVAENELLGIHDYGSALAEKLVDSETIPKCLIFAQFTRSLDVIEQLLFQPHFSALRYVRLDGKVPQEKRKAVVDAFNQDSNVKVMLLTTRIGGLGLNLTAANTVIFFESDYNPFADLQAMDRCRRIGQTQVVNIYRLVTQETIEEKILAMQEKKIKVADAVVNTDNSTMYSMGTDRLLDIFSDREDSTQIDSNFIKLDYDLEALIQRCSEDYASLSMKAFTGSLREQ